MYLHGDSAAADPLGKSSAPLNPLLTSISNIAQTALQSYATYQQLQSQNDLARLNLQRAQQGLSPINYQQIPGIVPTVQAQVGVDSGTQQILMYGLGAVALGLVLMSVMGNKRGNGGSRRHRHAYA